MKWSEAKHRKWRLPVIWDAGDELPATLTVTAETVRPAYRPVGVRQLHLTRGGDAAGFGPLALPPGAAAAEEDGG